MKNVFFNFISFGFLLTSLFSITSKNPVISVIFLITTFVLAAIYLILLGVNFIGISYIVIYVGAIAVLFLFVIMMINIKLTDILETGSNYTKNLPLAIVILTLFIFTLSSILVTSFFPGTGYFSHSTNYAFYPFSTYAALPFSINFTPESIASLANNLPAISGTGLFSECANPFLPFPAYATKGEGAPALLNDLSRVCDKVNNKLDTFFTNFEQIEVLGQNIYTYGAILLIILSIILLLAMLATIVISKQNKNI